MTDRLKPQRRRWRLPSTVAVTIATINAATPLRREQNGARMGPPAAALVQRSWRVPAGAPSVANVELPGGRTLLATPGEYPQLQPG